MSRENLETVRRAITATSGADRDWETINAVYHPEHVLVPATSALDGEVKGAAGAKEWFAVQEGIGTWESDLQGLVDMGPHVVLAHITVDFRGASSGASGEQQMWLVMELTGGKITRTLVFVRPHEAALEAARLSQ